MNEGNQDIEILDQSAIDRLREMVGGDEAFLAELIQTFLEDGPQKLSRMRQALESQDASLLRWAAHSLKSNSAEFGARTLQQMCRQLEQMGRQGVFDGAAERVSEIEAEYERVDEALRAVSPAS